MKPLFRKISNDFEKVAYAIQLPKESEEWPIEIIKTAYKQLPYLRKYEVDVELDRVDNARGYCVGKMMVYPAKMTKKAAVNSKKIVSFPVIVRDREVSPFDVYTHQKEMHPANESGVQEILLKETVFEGRANPKSFRPTNLGGQLDPPSERLRQSTGRSFNKTSSALDYAIISMDDQQKEEFKMQLKANPNLRVAAVNNPAFGEAVERVLTTKIASSEDVKLIRNAVTTPNVLQIRKDGMNYSVKSSVSDCFVEKTASATRFEIKKLLPEYLMEELNSLGTVTIVTNPVSYSETIKEASVATRAGIYSVHSGSTELTGIVIPKMISLEGSPMRGSLFLSDGGHAIQEKVAGVQHGEARLGPINPSGLGVFIYQNGPDIVATEPVSIRHEIMVEKNAHYLGTRLANGAEIKIHVSDEFKKIAGISETEFVIPSSMKFIPINGQQINVASDPSVATEISMVKSASNNSLSLISDGGYFSIRGNSPFAGSMYDKDDMSFILGAHGIKPASFIKKAAQTKMPVKISHSRCVTLEKEAHAHAIKSIRKFDVSKINVDLVKEASVIVDRETVDSILSLKFVTPENVSMYVGFIPELEKTSSKLAEILIASRLGMDKVKEASAKNAMGQLTKVIRDLKRIGAQIL